jgi:hypothetical protein
VHCVWGHFQWEALWDSGLQRLQWIL